MTRPIRNATWLWSTNSSASALSSAPAARPASASARSGTSALASPSAVASISRMASRYESVATRVRPSRFTSSRTPVRIGRASSRDAARTTCWIPSERAAPATVTRIPVGSCRIGKSSAGRHRTVPS